MAQNRTFTLISAINNGDLDPAQGWGGYGVGIVNTGSDSSGFFHSYTDPSTIGINFFNDSSIPVNSSSISTSVKYRVRSDDGARQISPYIRRTSIVYGSNIVTPLTFTNFPRTYATDPQGDPWTVAELFNVRHGIQAQSYGTETALYISEWELTATFTLPPPTDVTTGNATAVAGNTATLNGTFNPAGATSTYPCSYYFEYGLTAAYGSTTDVVAGQTGSSSVAASIGLTGLTNLTTYHFRLVVINGDNTANGADNTFTTNTTVAEGYDDGEEG